MTKLLARIDPFAATLTLLYGAAMLAGTHLPMQTVPGPVFDADKLIHFAAYGGLTLLLAVAITRRVGRVSWRSALAIFVTIAAIGAVDELTQPYVGRSCDFYDWVADASGALIAIAAYAVWLRIFAAWKPPRAGGDAAPATAEETPGSAA